MGEFTGNNYWESPGNVINPRPNNTQPMDVRDHPSRDIPNATEDHWGTVVAGYAKLKDAMVNKYGK